jgi:hypothetical protein
MGVIDVFQRVREEVEVPSIPYSGRWRSTTLRDGRCTTPLRPRRD